MSGAGSVGGAGAGKLADCVGAKGARFRATAIRSLVVWLVRAPAVGGRWGEAVREAAVGLVPEWAWDCRCRRWILRGPLRVVDWAKLFVRLPRVVAPAVGVAGRESWGGVACGLGHRRGVDGRGGLAGWAGSVRVRGGPGVAVRGVRERGGRVELVVAGARVLRVIRLACNHGESGDGMRIASPGEGVRGVPVGVLRCDGRVAHSS